MVTQLKQVNKTVRGYDLRELIGEGGFGAVYRAYQPTVGREVAIKIIQPEYANRPDFVRRFEAEAQIIARLEHFHIVPLYDYWRDPDGAYFVMRYLRGGTVRDLLSDGALPPPLIVRIVDQLASALAVAHRNNIIHRDIKPDNIMLDVDQNAYLADFGIAKLLEEGHTDEDAQSMVGSPAYSSPEQIRSWPVTPYSDQYSLGILLYEMLTGVHPYAGAAVTAMFAKHIQEPLPSVRVHRDDLPDVVDVILTRATDKTADARFPSIQELAVHLRDALAGLDVSTTKVGGALMGSTTAKFDVTPSKRETILLDMDGLEVGNPYKGLRAFQEADSADFFGREQLVEQLLAKLAEGDGRFLALVGPSGSGKSSVVKAGVIPAIKQGALAGSEDWFVVEMFPGAYPLEELEAALLRVSVRPAETLLETLKSGPGGLKQAVEQILPQDGSELVLYIDQFEEIFTFVEQEAEREQLLSLLLGATAIGSRVRVIVTLRADFYDRPLLYPSFGEMFRQHTEVVLPMNTAELEQAVVGPAERIGMQVEPSLVQAIVNDVGDQPGSLPLLQYALTELFERRDGPLLTLNSYTEIGGALGALVRRADDTFVQLPEQDQKTARQLFLRLVTLGEGTEDTRRRVLRGELVSLTGDDASMQRTINVFSRYRLLTLDRDASSREPTVEIAHESLIRQWAKLRDWLNNSREALRMQRRVMDAAADWSRYGRDSSYLARGAQLETFENWAEGTNLQLTALEQDYLQASLAQRDQIQAAQAAQRAREEALERRSRNILRALVAVLVVALLVSVALSVVAIRGRNAAETAAAVADRAADYSRSAGLAAQSRLALINGDVDLAVTLALEANRIEDPPPIARNMLFDAAYAPGTSYHFVLEDIEMSAAVHLDNGGVIYGTRSGQVGLWDPPAGTETALAGPGAASVSAMVAKPRSNQVLVGFSDGALIAVDGASGTITSRFGVTALDGSNSITAITHSRDLTTAVVGLQNGELLLVDLNTGDISQRLGTDDTRHGAMITRLRFSPDNRTLLSASVDRTVRLWALPSGELTGIFEAHTAPVRDVMFNDDGSRVVSGAQNGELFVWSPSAPDDVQRIATESIITNIWSVAFGPAGTLFTGGQDGLLRQWDLENGTLLDTFQGHTNTILTIGPLVRPGNVLTASADGSLRVWNFYNRQLTFMVEDTGSTQGGVFSMALSGNMLATGGAFGSLNLYDAQTGEKNRATDERLVTVNTSFTEVLFVRDRTQLLTGALDGTVNLWDLETGSQVGEFERHRGAVQALAVRETAGQVASSGPDQILRISDLETGAEITRLLEGESVATALAYSPSGDLLVAGTADGRLVAYNADTYLPVNTLDGAFAREVSALAFNATGALLVAGSYDQTARVLDPTNLETVMRLVGHEDPIQAVAFAADDRSVLTASGDTFAEDTDVSIRLWEIETGQQLRRFGNEHPQEINDLVVSSDGRAVITADGASNLIRYEMLPADDLLAFTEANRYARPLTCGERALYDLDRGDCP